MAGGIILHDSDDCCALAKKKWNEVQNGKDAPPFWDHGLFLSGQALDITLRPRHHNKQRQRAVNNHPS